MDSSPFNRSSRTAHSPPPARSPAPRPPAPPPRHDDEEIPGTVSNADFLGWMSTIEQYLTEVCTIAQEGKLNSDQKLRITTLCRKVGHGTSQMAVQYQFLKNKTVEARSSIQALKSQSELAQQLQQLQQSFQESKKSTEGSSFADMVKRGSNKYIQPANLSSVAIYPNDKLKSSDETKSLVQKIIDPEEMKLHVRGLRKTRNGGVIISTDTKDDIEKLKQSVQLKNSGFTVAESHKRKPRIVVIGVPTAMQESEVFTCLYHQNLADKLQGSTVESFLSSINLSHKSGKKDSESCNYIIEVTPAIRKALISKERVFVNWSSCPVRDFTLVTRCYKCQQYGHAAKSCRQSEFTCGHCGEQGHSIKDCLKKAEEPKCATCLHFKKSSNHATGSAECPAKTMAEKRYINSIDYEGA